MSGKCYACGAPCDGDVCDWQCAARAYAEARADQREADTEDDEPSDDAVARS